MSSYDDATKRWAAKKYDLPVEKIGQVTIDHDKAGGYAGCDTCGYGADECDFEVYITFVKGYKVDGKDTLYKPGHSFDTLLRELLEA